MHWANKKGDEDGANDDDAGDEDSQSWTKEVPSSSGWPISDERNDDERDLYIIGAICLSQKWLFCPTELSRTFRNHLEPSRTF